MENVDYAPLIIALGTLITAIAGLITAWRGKQIAAEAKEKAAEAKDQSIQTHMAVNSRMTELLELTKKQSGDEATLAEKSAQSEREKAAAVAVAKAEVK